MTALKHTIIEEGRTKGRRETLKEGKEVKATTNEGNISKYEYCTQYCNTVL